MVNGTEWMVEAHGCDPLALADPERLRALFERIVEDLQLRPVAPAQWHKFPDLNGAAAPGGITGLCLLAESHLACHTFPEHGSLCLNLFCCKPRHEWDFAAYLKKRFAAQSICVRRFDRPYQAAPVSALAAGARLP